MIYSAIGRAVVKLGVWFVRRRFAMQIRVAFGLGIAAALLGAFLASRGVREG